MIDVNLQAFRHKDDAASFCAQNGTTIKIEVLKNIDEILDALVKIAGKIEKNERAENEDWMEAAVPLNSMMNAVANGWYLED